MTNLKSTHRIAMTIGAARGTLASLLYLVNPKQLKYIEKIIAELDEIDFSEFTKINENQTLKPKTFKQNGKVSENEFIDLPNPYLLNEDPVHSLTNII